MNFANYLLKDKKNNNNKIFVNEGITYSKLFKIVNKNSKNNFFKNKGLIGICFENSSTFLIFYLSIIKSGNTAVIFENGLSQERYIHLLKKFRINFFISYKDFDNGVLESRFKKEFKKRFMNCNNIFFYTKIISKKKSIQSSSNSDVAVVLFTSGSTGEKKGVMLTHSNLIVNSSSILKILPIIPSDIVNLILPVSYSFGLSILNTHIKVGAKIYLHNSPFVGSIIKELKKYKCTSFYGVPSTFEILLNKTLFIKEKFYHLRYIGQAGGRLEIKLKKILISKYKNNLYIMYGATEASPRLSYVPPTILHKKIDSVGIPIPGVKFNLVRYKNTNNMQLVVSGKNIMKGYLNDIKLTKKYKKKKYLITGDFASKDNDGYYYLRGRSDKIVKRFGYKINLDLVKSFVNKINNVIDSELFLDNNKELILLVQVNKKKQGIEKTVKSQLSKRFARYERPDKIVLINKNLKDFNKKISYYDIYNKYIV